MKRIDGFMSYNGKYSFKDNPVFILEKSLIDSKYYHIMHKNRSITVWEIDRFSRPTYAVWSIIFTYRDD